MRNDDREIIGRIPNFLRGMVGWGRGSSLVQLDEGVAEVDGCSHVTGSVRPSLQTGSWQWEDTGTGVGWGGVGVRGD